MSMIRGRCETSIKNGREPFLTSRSDGPKGDRKGWQVIKKGPGGALYCADCLVFILTVFCLLSCEHDGTVLARGTVVLVISCPLVVVIAKLSHVSLVVVIGHRSILPSPPGDCNIGEILCFSCVCVHTFKKFKKTGKFLSMICYGNV